MSRPNGPQNSPPGNRHRSTYNHRAMFKVCLIAVVITASFYLDHPAMYYAGEWTHDAQWYAFNNTTGNWTWANMSTIQKTTFILFPGVFLIPMMSWYAFVTRMHRRTLIRNGYPDGVVMWTYGITPHNSHIYDLYCVLRGFKKVPWEEFPMPISQEFYRGKMVIFYRTSILESPLEWHKLVIDTPNQMTTTPYKMFIEGMYSQLIKHPINPMLSYVFVHNQNGYVAEDPDVKRLSIYHRDTLRRIQRDNISMLESNPDIAGHMVKSSMMTLPPSLKGNFLDLLSDEEREEYLRKAHKGTEN